MDFGFHVTARFPPWNTHLGSEEYEPDARDFEVNSTSSARSSG